MHKDFTGLVFTNLVDTDMLYGHRRDPKGFAEALEYIDPKLPEVQRSFLGIPADKIAHFMMFFPLPVIAFFAFGKKNEKKMGPVVASIVSITAFSCILAGITEIIQGSLPYRSEDINDFKADCLAIIIAGLAILVYCIIIKKKKRHRK